jgi:hypothetical protein
MPAAVGSSGDQQLYLIGLRDSTVALLSAKADIAYAYRPMYQLTY